VIGLLQPSSMIADVSLRLLYLIFNGLLNWLTLLSPRIPDPVGAENRVTAFDPPFAVADLAVTVRPGPQRDQGARRLAAFSPRCTWRSSSMRWCTSCSTLVQASAASCWVVESPTAAACR
jgi:hypothetical protein